MNASLQNLGSDLARQRQAKGMTIAQISDKTKITGHYIEKMENGQFDFLPIVYVKAFLRTIAFEIGLDPEVMVKQLIDFKSNVKEISPEIPQAEMEQSEQSVANQSNAGDGKEKLFIQGEGYKEKATIKTGIKKWNTPFIFIVIFVTIASILYILLSRGKSEIPQEIETGLSVVAPSSKIYPENSNLVPIHSESKPDTSKDVQLFLTIKAIETAWVRIIHQDSLVDEGIFSPGDVRTWNSHKKFYMKIGNAGGIRLVLDGRELGTPGERGRIANILVTKDGITPITYAEFPPAMGRSLP